MEKNKMTAIDWYWDKTKSNYEHDGDLFESATFTYAIAKRKEKEQIIEHLIGLQIYLNDKGLIINHDWDFEKLANQYIKKEKLWTKK